VVLSTVEEVPGSKKRCRLGLGLPWSETDAERRTPKDQGRVWSIEEWQRVVLSGRVRDLLGGHAWPYVWDTNERKRFQARTTTVHRVLR